MKEENYQKLRNVLSVVALSGIISISLITNKNKDDSEMINAYVYEMNDDNECVNVDMIDASIEEIKENHLLDEYSGKIIKIVDVNENYEIDKVKSIDDKSVSFVYIKDGERYLNPFVVNATESGYYSVLSIANEKAKAKVYENNKEKKLIR